MDPATISLIVSVLLKYGPETARALVQLFRKPQPTDADWEALFLTAEKSYEDYVKPTTTP